MSYPRTDHVVRRRRALPRIAALACLLFALGLLAAATAGAGSYVVSACLAAPNGENNAWIASQTSSHVTAYSGTCNNITADGLTARTSVEAPNTLAPNLDYALWSFDAPSGAVITQADLSAFVYRFGNTASFIPEQWGTGLVDETGAYLWGNGGLAPLYGGTVAGSYFTVPVPSRTHLQFGVVCASWTGCLTASTGVYSPPVVYMRALARLYGARVTISDSSAPALSGGRGALWTSSGWIGGTQIAGFDATDNVGVKNVTIAIDGDVHSSTSGCNYTRRVPCPGSRFYDTTFSTSGLSDGAHTLSLTATDSADNPATASRTISVDNTAPAAPAPPALQGAPSAQWRTANAFTVSYSNPATGGGSPNQSSDVQICPTDAQGQADTSQCTTRAFASAAGANAFSVPSQGQFRARVRVHDALYTGAWSDWSAVLRFDDVVPAGARPRQLNGWLSRQELVDGMRIDRPAQATQPASGWAGYATRSDGQLPGTAVDTPAADPVDGSATISLASWPDGVHALSVRAVSRAGLASSDADVRTTTVRIDTHAPSVAVAGAPDQGAEVSRPVVLDVSATDGTSGMDPSPSTEPDPKRGAYLAYSIDGGPETLVRGGRATISSTDGRHTVSVAAVDVAGNRSQAQAFTFTQDTAAPQGGLLPPDPSQPRELRFFVAEQCIKSATVELSTDDGASWQALQTVVADQLVSAQIPDPVWDARAAYAVRAQVTDCAGNGATLDTWYGGPDDGRPIGRLVLPQRLAVKITASFSHLELAKRCTTVTKPRLTRDGRGRPKIIRRRAKVCPKVKARRSPASAAEKKVFSRTREVYGVLTDASGRPLAGQDVRVQTQPKTITDRWNTVRVLKTDDSGLLRTRVRKFTSLRIRLVYPRNEVYGDGVSQTLVTQVRGTSTIRAAPRSLLNGQLVRLTGHVLGGHVPPGGMQIALYGFSPAKKRWLPVRTTVKVDPKGDWVAFYRFTATNTRVTYRFRARLAARPTWPFATGYSRTVRVTVRP